MLRPLFLPLPLPGLEGSAGAHGFLPVSSNRHWASEILIELSFPRDRCFPHPAACVHREASL